MMLEDIIKGISGTIKGEMMPENNATKLGKKANQRAFLTPKKNTAKKRVALTKGPATA